MQIVKSPTALLITSACGKKLLTQGSVPAARLYDDAVQRLTRSSASPLLALLLAAGACQQYVELGVPAPPANMDVRLTLSDSGGNAAYGPLGSSLRQIEGRTTAVNDSSVRMLVTGVTRKTGYDESWGGDPVAVPRSYIVSVEKRKLSVPRTLATIGAVIAGSYFVGSALNHGETTSGTINKPGGHN